MEDGRRERLDSMQTADKKAPTVVAQGRTGAGDRQGRDLRICVFPQIRRRVAHARCQWDNTEARRRIT